MPRYGWDHPLTAERYAAFCARPTRYRFANAALARAADAERAASVLDFAAGLGHTAEALLPRLPSDARVLCVEPATAMREAGKRRLADARVGWAAELPAAGAFDRIVSGAGLWQVDDLRATLARLCGLLASAGRLCFTIPSLYLGVPDREGCGRDPLLLELFRELARGRSPAGESATPLPSEAELIELLGSLGLLAKLERLEYRLDQTELRDWAKIPVLTDALLSDLDAAERDRRVDLAFEATDPTSHRWEGWTVVSATRRV